MTSDFSIYDMEVKFFTIKIKCELEKVACMLMKWILKWNSYQNGNVFMSPTSNRSPINTLDLYEDHDLLLCVLIMCSKLQSDNFSSRILLFNFCAHIFHWFLRSNNGQFPNMRLKSLFTVQPNWSKCNGPTGCIPFAWNANNFFRNLAIDAKPNLKCGAKRVVHWNYLSIWIAFGVRLVRVKMCIICALILNQLIESEKKGEQLKWNIF